MWHLAFGSRAVRLHDWAVPPAASTSPDGPATTGHDPAETSSVPAALIERRAQLLDRAQAPGTRPDEASELAELTAALEELLSHGHRVRYLDPAASPTDVALAERLAAAEPVHPAGSPAARERRFAKDRRVVVIEHPAVAGRPLNVVWVALCQGLPRSLDEILDPSSTVIDPHSADTAVFYSIWNAQAGLAGLGKGRELICGAAELLREEFHRIDTLTTLSPIPGFRAWAESRSDDTDPVSHCARYLTAKGTDGRLIDPVARFHMGNGARLWLIQTDADSSPRGQERSFGIMACYRYFPEDLAANSRSLGDGTPVLGQAVAALLRH